MKLLSVRICNFRSFQSEQTFSFPDGPGLYFMQGINEAEPRLQANGAGKSTIWDAILWCIFAKTSRGLKAGDVCNWNVDKGAEVSVDLFNEDDPLTVWTVTRSWKPNRWILSHISERITDEEVIDLTKDPDNLLMHWLRLEFTPFLHSILMAQGQPMFLDLKHDQQAALFSEVLGLDHWLEYSSAASRKASAQDMQTRVLERRLSEVMGRLDGQRDFQGSVSQFEEERKARLREIETPYVRALEDRREKTVQLETLKEDVIRARTKFQRFVQKLDDIEPRMKEHADLLTNITRDLDRAEVEWLNAQDMLKGVRESEVCPTCHRAVDKDSHERHLLDAEAKEALLDMKVQKITKTRNQHIKDGKGLVTEYDQVAGSKKKAGDELDAAEQAVSRTRQAILAIDKQLDSLEAEADRVTNEVNPFLEVQEQAKEEGRRLRQDHEQIRKELDASSEAYSLYSYWVRGFKELRLFLIAEALTELEIEVNSCVTALGLVNWELRFQVDRETKGGSIQRGFSVQVVSPNNTKITPWEAWSGGESQRLRLAANMGLANLIRSRMGVELDLEVWDEPSTALSPQGVQDLLGALEHRAQQEQRQIWVVDHTAHSFGGFAGGATITKTKEGSSISQY